MWKLPTSVNLEKFRFKIRDHDLNTIRTRFDNRKWIDGAETIDKMLAIDMNVKKQKQVQEQVDK